MMRRVLPLLVGLLALPAAAGAQEVDAPRFTAVRVGFADRYQAGLWTPVELTLAGGSQTLTGRVIVTVPDSEGVPSRVMTEKDACRIEPGKQTTVRLCVRFGNVESSLEAEFQADGQTVARRTFETGREADDDHFLPAVNGQGLIVYVGADPGPWRDALALPGVETQSKAVVAQVPALDSLPCQWYAYEGVDTVVLSSGHPEVFGEPRPNGSQIAALGQWVRMGGRVIITGGSQAADVLGPGKPLASLLPGRFERVVTFSQTGALETYAQSGTGIAQAEGEPAELSAARLTGIEDKTELAEADLPLVVRAARGLGQVVYCAVGLDEQPLARWSDRRLLATKLLDLPIAHGEQPEETYAGVALGYSDLAGQLRSGLDQFAGVIAVPFWLLAVLAATYILLIGPADYFLHRRLTRRMVWTWITFPVIVVVVSLAAYGMAYRLKGDRVRINRAELVDVDTVSGLVRGATWANVFSPRMETFDLSLSPRLPDGVQAGPSTMLFSWLGLPGDGLGGMGRGAAGAGPALWEGYYDFATDLGAIEALPIQVWSSRSLVARWGAESQTSFVKTKLTEQDRLPVGTITNQLDHALSRCVLAYDRWAYDVGSLAPGQSVEIGPRTVRTELRTFLTGRGKRASDKTKRQEAPGYDPSNTDPAYALQAMLFYQAAGGQRYTGLANQYQRFVDLSGLLRTGRAVLVAYTDDLAAAERGSQVLRDGDPLGGPQDGHKLVYRFVVPVGGGDRR